ncbi:minor capsid protein [Streptococcus pluranimalium]|uniref:minor capsid protein n=1 Tax=Streptococcus pluranimalium TaxID=82348 RepID=UPI0039ED308B
MIGFKVEVIFNASKLIAKSEATARTARFALSNQIKKDSDRYIPAREWNLRDSGRATERSVSWHTPYARRLYYNPQYNFSKDKNPNAQGKWFEAAKANKLEHWLDLTKKAYGAAFGGD